MQRLFHLVMAMSLLLAACGTDSISDEPSQTAVPKTAAPASPTTVAIPIPVPPTTAAPVEPVLTATEEERLIEEAVAALNAGSVDCYLGYYSEDAIVFGRDIQDPDTRTYLAGLAADIAGWQGWVVLDGCGISGQRLDCEVVQGTPFYEPAGLVRTFHETYVLSDMGLFLSSEREPMFDSTQFAEFDEAFVPTGCKRRIPISTRRLTSQAAAST